MLATRSSSGRVLVVGLVVPAADGDATDEPAGDGAKVPVTAACAIGTAVVGTSVDAKGAAVVGAADVGSSVIVGASVYSKVAVGVGAEVVSAAVGDKVAAVALAVVDRVVGFAVGAKDGATVASSSSSTGMRAVGEETSTPTARGVCGLVGSIAVELLVATALSGIQKSVFEYSSIPPIHPGTSIFGSR